jgi:Tol biopolymer transport system component
MNRPWRTACHGTSPPVGSSRQGHRIREVDVNYFCASALGIAIPVSLVVAFSAQAPLPATAMFTDRPPSWFEDLAKVGDVSPDGRWLVYGVPGARRLIDQATGREAGDRFARDFESVRDGIFRPDGTIVRRGSRAGHAGWFAGEGSAIARVRIPEDAAPRWSSDGRVAFTRTAEWSLLRVGEDDATQTHDFGRRIVGFAWTLDGRAILVLARETDGGSSLHSLDVASGATRVVASGLDTSAWFPGPAPLPDGRSVIVALASSGRPNPEARHRPHSDRDQDLYSIDLASGERRRLTPSPGDDFAPVVAGGKVYWTRNQVEHAVVVVPFRGGEAHVLANAGELPSWHPSGRRLAFMIGDWRLVDIPMNFDAVVVDIDERGRSRLPARPLITGYHEDFPPVWSRDGRWMAYHSHRSPTAIPFYNAGGATDDIYLRRADDPKAEEIRLTDFGLEVGTPSWSPDGRRLLFSSEDRAAPSVGIPWIVTIDPESGRRARVEKWQVPEQIKSVKGFAWSPSRQEIAVEADGSAPGTRELWIASVDGARAERIATFRSTTHGGADWTPDGKTIAFAGLAGNRMQLFAVERGSPPRQLTHDGFNLLHPRVSPDGRWIAATRIRVTKSLMRFDSALGAVTHQ